MTHRFDPTSLREYDIRGIVGKTLGTEDAYAIGRGFASHVRRAGGEALAERYRKGRLALAPEAMRASANFALANRHVLTDGLRAAFAEVTSPAITASSVSSYAGAVAMTLQPVGRRRWWSVSR